ncbi:hypothetical protein BH10PLA1_BH10PLA1_12250 [soil metagenome]
MASNTYYQEESFVGIRESLHRNPSVTTGITLGIIVVAFAAIFWQARENRPNFAPAKSFYTVDDGKTWFIDESNKTIPFDHNGQQAVRVYVYQCVGGKPFAGYMERYSEEGLKKLQEANSKPEPPDIDTLELIYQSCLEVKKPGDAKWVLRFNQTGDMGSEIDVKCPDGTDTAVQQILPGQ